MSGYGERRLLAQRQGIYLSMRPQDARLACPELLLCPVDMAASQAAQDTLLATLGEWELPVEPQGWGMAYSGFCITVAQTAATVQPLAAELGKRLRRTLGEPLQPALGWDSGKFTARAAAMQTPPGYIKLVDKADEVRFLADQSIALLPLPRPHLQQLHWLGIRTLGQFARLPTVAVWQRFGPAGKVAQQWAQGRDERPVHSAVRSPQAGDTVTLDPPTGRLQSAVDALMNALTPVLETQRAQLEGLRRVQLTFIFVDGEEGHGALDFVEPTTQPSRVQAALVQQLCALRWPSALQAIRWTLLATGELVAPQLSLFAEDARKLVSIE